MKAREVTFEDVKKSYKTRENALKAIEAVPRLAEDGNQRFIILQRPDGRYVPVFIGEQALQVGAHFHFCVLG